jgi:hypothetical protein
VRGAAGARVSGIRIARFGGFVNAAMDAAISRAS